ncbi:hypothetical protein QEN19_001183 [Hanseniaspora menglaensis]
MTMKPVYWGETSKNSAFDDIYEIRRGQWLESVNTIHAEASKKQLHEKIVSIKGKQEMPMPVYIAEQIETALANDKSYLSEEKLITIRDQNNEKTIGKIFVQNENTIFQIPKEQLSIYDNVLTLKLIKQNIFTVGLKKYIKQNPFLGDELSSLINLEASELPLKKKVHLTFCVHGIGQTLGSKYEYVNFPKTISTFRENIKKQVKLLKPDNLIDEETTIQVLPITWRNKLDFNHPSKDQNLPSFAEICPSGAITIRSLIGDIGLDILLYENQYYREKIIEAVVSELNWKFSKFKKLHPESEITVSLIGHSLGSLILFDILNEHKYSQKLDFEVVNFFGVGSPVSIFKLIQKFKFSNHLYCRNYYNVFHECDVIGYRVEPLIHRSLSKVQPVQLETLSSPDIIIDKVKNFNVLNEYLSSVELIRDNTWLKNISMDKKSEPHHIEEMHKFNSFGRLDYIIKSKLLDIDMINALRSHVSYFEELDFINFIVKRLLAKNQSLTLKESLKMNKLT